MTRHEGANGAGVTYSNANGAGVTYSCANGAGNWPGARAAECGLRRQRREVRGNGGCSKRVYLPPDLAQAPSGIYVVGFRTRIGPLRIHACSPHEVASIRLLFVAPAPCLWRPSGVQSPGPPLPCSRRLPVPGPWRTLIPRERAPCRVNRKGTRASPPEPRCSFRKVPLCD